MDSISGLIALSMLIIVILGWFVFTAIFLFRKKPTRTEEQKRDKASIIGIVMQDDGYVVRYWISRELLVGNRISIG